jgi:hypothetical protein
MSVLTQEVLDKVRAALEFYAEDRHRVSITFAPTHRPALLQRMKDEPGWMEYGEDSGGHELFVENGARAQAALNAIAEELP